jgi:type I restriction enzyme R subunit
MVVTRNIECAIRYFFAIRDALKEANAPFKALVAFSGEKMVKGIKYTEESLNGISARRLARTIREGRYQDSGGCQQVPDRVRRTHAAHHVRGQEAARRSGRAGAVPAESLQLEAGQDATPSCSTSTTRVDDIKAAFDPFYTSTTLSEPTDVNVLHDLKDVLDNFGIYDWAEVTTFNESSLPVPKPEELAPIIDVVVARFDADLDDEERIDFKIKAKQFVKIYAQVAAIIPFKNVNWEMLHWFLKFLIPKLKVKDPDQDKLDELLDSVDLSTYGLERSRLEAKIGLDAAEAELEPQNPNVRGPTWGRATKTRWKKSSAPSMTGTSQAGKPRPKNSASSSSTSPNMW